MIVSFTALHYGKDYLAYALHSVVHAVDACYVAYCPHGSHGHQTDVPCPDTREELLREAVAGAGDKLRWYEGDWGAEHEQRDSIFTFAPDADAILVVDYDEIWQTALPELAIRAALKGNQRNVLLPMRHYWRSFSKCILHDPACPVRAINPNIADGVRTLNTHDVKINHMGYAIRPELMEYKWRIHGHLDQMRTDCDYLNDIYLANRQTDCHPVGSEYWNAERVEPLRYLPYWMADHPYYGREVIE